jgi:hypothetical protein
VLLSYVTTLAFYLHLASLPSDKRPDFNTHPILVRLLQLKEAVNAMEEAEFSAGSVNEDEKIQLFQRIKDIEDDDDDDDDEEMTEAQKEMLAKYMAGGMGDIDWDDAQDLWEGGSLEDGELDELQADASLDMGSEDDDDDDEEEDEEMEDDEDEEMEDLDDLDDLEDLEESDEEPAEVKPSKKGKEKKSKNKPSVLEEPEFVPASKSKKSGANKSIFEEEDMGDLTALSASEQAERTAKKRSLRFHTSKIAATSARRSAAREARLQGDEDVPYKNRQAARDAALQRNSARGAAGEDLDGEEWSEKDKKRAREAMDTEKDGEDYYETVKRRRTDEKDAKQQAHDDAREEERRVAKLSIKSFRHKTNLRFRIVDAHLWSPSQPMDLDLLLERSKRTEDLHLGEPRRTGTPVSRRGRTTRRRRGRSSPCVRSTPVGRVLWVDLIRERRLVSLPRASRDGSKRFRDRVVLYILALYHNLLHIYLFVILSSSAWSVSYHVSFRVFQVPGL